MEDERIEILRNKIFKEIVNIILVICLISSFIKLYMYNMGNASVVLEFAILIIIIGYYIVRSVSLGVYSDEQEMHDREHKSKWNKKIMQKSIAIVLGLALVRGVNSVINNSDASTPDFLLFFIVAFATIVLGIPIVYFAISIFFSITEKVRSKQQNNE